MTTQRQQFNEGMDLSKLSAGRMQEQADRVEAHEAMVFQSPLRAIRAHRQVLVSIDQPAVQQSMPERTVAVTAIGTHTLTVKPVRYKANPPKQCPTTNPPADCGIEVVEQEIEAYPDYGRKPAEFASLIYIPPVTDATQYVKLYWQEGTWLVKFPGGGGAAQIEKCRIVGTPEGDPDGEGELLLVRIQTLNDQGETVDASEEDVEVSTWDGRPAKQYLGFVGTVDRLMLINWRGLWQVFWDFRYDVRAADETVPIGTCPL